MIRVIPLMLSLLLAGCSAAGQARVQALNDKLIAVTTADLDQAIAIAQQANDPDGVACATAIKGTIGASGAILLPKGVFSAYMQAREIHRRVTGGIDPAIHRACAVLVIDAEQTLIKLGLTAMPGGGIPSGLLPR